ncbi:MAG: DUF4982 domain-containing protein [Firmicutes bacterium]|nr:DUF4982 domain-containing protein [Bacillota bacterium]
MLKSDFNRGWTVRKEGSDKIRKVNLPDDAMLFEARRKDAPAGSGSGYFETGKYIYEKEWDISEEQAGKTLILECEGVYQNASVLLNGEKLNEWPYGYTNFFTNLSGKVQPGRNVLTVIADNEKAPNSRWYSGSGIYREVSLYEAGDQYIDPEGIRVDVISQSKVKISVSGSWEEGTKALVQILDGDQVVAQGESGETFKLENARLWSAETPELYIAKACLVKDGKVLDEACARFGIRELSWGPKGFKVNGKEVLLRGGCIHHDNGILGAAAFRDAEYRKVRILKEAGFNAIRSSHNPASKALLDACDELGMYVMDEAFDMWLIQKNPFDFGGDTFKAWWKKDVKAMVQKDVNHPSVVMYSLGNEISDLGIAEGQEIEKEMAAYVRSLDDSRPLTMGINLMLAVMAAKGKGLYGKDKDGNDKGNGASGLDNMPTSSVFNAMMNKMGNMMDMAAASAGADKIVEKVSGVLDMPGYNYATSRYKKEVKKYPLRPFTGSETMPQNLYKNWQLVKKLPNLTGDFMWTSWDYLGESAIGTIQYKDKKTKQHVEEGLIISGGAGIIDICGKKRPEVGWGKLIWNLTDQPTIGVDPLTHADHFRQASMWRVTDAIGSWSWPGYEGRKTNVTVYANTPVVELLINGQQVAKGKTKEDKVIFKDIVYTPGKIEALAIDAAGREIGRALLTSAEGPARISLKPEKTSLTANGQDLCFVDIDLVGENGETISSQDQKLSIRVEGAASLQAFGSARPHMAEIFVSDTHTTFYGKALAVIRAGYEAGKAVVTVSGEGLEDQRFEIEISK